MEENSTPIKGELIKIPKETPLPFPYPLKAIREKCKDCSNYQEKEIRYCPMTDCALWFFRFGENPKYSKRSSEAIFEE